MLITSSSADGPRGDRRVEAAALLTSVLAGALMGILPHLACWPAMRGPAWFADYDDLMAYMAIGGQAYFHHPFRLGEPILPTFGASYYPTLQLTPGILLAKALGTGPGGINLAWRLLAGAGLGAGSWFAIRGVVRDPWIASALSLLFLADAGVVAGWPLAKHATVLLRLAREGKGSTLFTHAPVLCPLWRLVTPALSTPFLLLHVALVARARARPTTARLLASGAGFGLLSPVYFYDWTAAGLALVLAFVLDAGHRRVYLRTAWIGGLVGLPTLIAQAAHKASTSSDWLHRNDLFLPIPRLSGLEAGWKYVVPLIIAVPWAWARRPELLYLGSLAVAGLILRNHQVVSGLEIQNWHWIYVIGVSQWLLLTLLVVAGLGRLARGRPLRAAAWGVALAVFASGLGLRAIESSWSRYPREIRDDYLAYRAQRLGPGAPALEANAVCGGDWPFLAQVCVFEDVRPLEHFTVLNSPSISNDEWDARAALNAYLRGLGRDAFASEQRAILRSNEPRRGAFGVFGPWVAGRRRAGEALEERISGRLARFDEVVADPARALRRFRVRYVALPASSPTPAPLRQGWRIVQAGPHWILREWVGRLERK